VYGKYDQFNLETAHVIPALIHILMMNIYEYLSIVLIYHIN